MKTKKNTYNWFILTLAASKYFGKYTSAFSLIGRSVLIYINLKINKYE